jgi:hypothetical protein
MKAANSISSEDQNFIEKFSEYAFSIFFYSLLLANAGMIGALCYNPLFTILMKNILVLDFCSMLILFNMKYNDSIRKMLKILFKVAQSQIVENVLFDFQAYKYSGILNFRGNINLVGTKSSMVENAGLEICLFGLLMVVMAILYFAMKPQKLKKNRVYSVCIKLCIVSYGFFNFDYWLSCILGLTNMVNSVSYGSSTENYNVIKIIISTALNLVIFNFMIFFMIKLYCWKVRPAKSQKSIDSDFDKFVNEVKSDCLNGMKSDKKNQELPHFCKQFNFYFLALFKFCILLMPTLKSSGLA